MEMQQNQKVVNTGTTTVGLVCKDGLILASDKRATMGYLIASKDIDKIHPLDSHMGMTIAGGVGDAQELIRWMSAEIRLYKLKHDKRMSAEAAATLLSNILAQSKYYHPFFVQLLLGGMDEDGRIRLFSIDMAGGVTEEKLTSTGSGSTVAYGVLEELYKEDGMLSDNLKVAAKAISAAMKRDAATGERVDVIVIDKQGFRRLDKSEVKNLIG